MEIVTISNQKGGVGKTTTALALGQGLALLKEKKVLLVDLDPQGNLSSCFKGVDLDGRGSYELFQRDADKNILNLIQHDEDIKNLDIIPSSDFLSILQNELSGKPGGADRLKIAFRGLNNAGYDFIVIDTPPALSMITLNAFSVADCAIVPVQADAFSLMGLGQFYDTLQEVNYVKEQGNLLKIDGILLVRTRRTKLTNSINEKLQNLAEQINTKTYKANIRDATTVKEAQVSKICLFNFDKSDKNIAATDYKEFIDEFMKGDRKDVQ